LFEFISIISIAVLFKLFNCSGRKRKRLADDIEDRQPEVKKTKTDTGAVVTE